MPQEVRDLVVTGCEQIATGTRDGKPWALFKVRAQKPNGEPVGVQLRSFVELAVGERSEFKVTGRKDEQYGDSFLLTPKRPSLRVMQQRLDRAEERIEDLETEMAKLINALTRAGAALP